MDRLIKNYKDKDFFIIKKAEYSFPFVIVMMLAILVIVTTEFFILEDTLRAVIIGGISLLAFCVVFAFLYVGKYETGLNLMIGLGFVRLFLIFGYTTPFQFYAMMALILVSVNVLYIRKYQIYFTDIGALSILIAQSVRISHLVESGVLEKRSFYESALAIFLFLAMFYMLRYIRTIIDREITENNELQNLAQRDSLTNLYNRRKITEYFNDYLRHKRKFKIILFDIDNFKQVNDSFGHKIGDEVLVEIARIIMLRYDNTGFSRWGGEEFLLITELEADIATDILELISNHVFPNDIRITVSIGETMVGESDSIVTAVTRADKAMYISKQNGKNRITVL